MRNGWSAREGEKFNQELEMIGVRYFRSSWLSWSIDLLLVLLRISVFASDVYRCFLLLSFVFDGRFPPSEVVDVTVVTKDTAAAVVKLCVRLS